MTKLLLIAVLCALIAGYALCAKGDVKVKFSFGMLLDLDIDAKERRWSRPAVRANSAACGGDIKGRRGFRLNKP